MKKPRPTRQPCWTKDQVLTILDADRPKGQTTMQWDPTALAAGTYKLKIVPKGKTKHKLTHRGKVNVKVTVTFTPNGGTANA